MVTKYDRNKVKGYKVNFSKEKGTSFGGIVLLERLAKRLGLWRDMAMKAPERKRDYDWMTIIKSSIIGLLTGSRCCRVCVIRDILCDAPADCFVAGRSAMADSTF